MSGLPPSGDVGEERIMKLMEDKLSLMEAKWREKHDQLQRKTEILEAMLLPEHRYKDLGGDTFFYMKQRALYEVLKKHCGNDEEKLKQLEDWAKSVNKKANRRIIACAGAAALTGLAVGGIIVGGTHLCAGSTVVVAGVATTITGVTAWPAIGIVAAAVAGGLIIFGIGYGIAKLVRHFKVKNAVDAGSDEEAPIIQTANDNPSYMATPSGF